MKSKHPKYDFGFRKGRGVLNIKSQRGATERDGEWNVK